MDVRICGYVDMFERSIRGFHRDLASDLAAHVEAGGRTTSALQALSEKADSEIGDTFYG